MRTSDLATFALSDITMDRSHPRPERPLPDREVAVRVGDRIYIVRRKAGRISLWP
jgi:hypothetical protein